MSDSDIPPIAAKSNEIITEIQNENSKSFYRKKVWDFLEKNKLTMFPRPVYDRIPNFRGCDEASARLAHLDEFESAKSVEVNPDKPLEQARILVLRSDNKTLYVPVPRLKAPLMKKLSVSKGTDAEEMKKTVSQWGIENSGEAVDFNDELHIDLLVVGSVAVSREGRRIGKGKGYADLEFAILKELKAIDDKTAIVTIVHDSQVFDTLPEDIFKKYDIPLDYILTPTETIKVEKKFSRPEGIYWDVLSKKQVSLVSILQKLKDQHEAEGKCIVLKEKHTEGDSELKRQKRTRKFTNKRRQTSTSSKVASETGDEDGGGEKKPHKSNRRRPKYASHGGSVPDGASNEDAENIPPKRHEKIRKPFRRYNIDFSLMVSNIEKNVRVRDLKNALLERGIKPDDITWRGYKGFCLLHYAKPSKKKAEDQQPFAVDNVIEILQNMKLSPESESNLVVKVMEPVTRIETTDVTAV